MLRIEVEGQNVDLSPDMSINLSFKSPVFDDDNASRAHSLPHRLPMSPATMNRLENLNRLDSAADLETLEEKIYIGGRLLARGKFVIEKAGQAGQYIDGHFTNEAKSYSANLDGVKLHDLVETIEFPQTYFGWWELVLLPAMLGRRYLIHINDAIIDMSVTVSSETTHTIANKIANRITAETGLSASVHGDGWQNAKIMIKSWAQQVHLRPWSGKMESMSLGQYQTTGNAKKQNFTEFINGCVSTPRADISFAQMRNGKFYEDNYLYEFFINPCEKTNGRWNIKQNGFQDAATLKAWNYNFVPFIRAKFILGKIAEKIGVSEVSGNFSEWSELFNNLVLYNNYALDEIFTEWQFNAANGTEMQKSCNVGATYIDLKNHCPDMTGREFLRTFCESFCLSWSVVDGRLLFQKKDDLLKYSSNLLLGKVVPGSVERGFKKRDGFTLKCAASKTDAAAQPAASYIQGNGKVVIPLPTAGISDLVSYGKRYCYVEEIGASSLKKNDSIGLRWMLDRGEQADLHIQGNYYIQSTSFLGNVPLLPSQLVQWTWLHLAYLRGHAYPIAFRVNADVGTLKQLIDWETGIYKIETPDGNAQVAIETVDVAASTHDLKETKITGFATFF